jgi:hypothetical protein
VRQYFYEFAHRVLPHDVHEEPALWNIVSGSKAAPYLAKRWSDAGGPASEKGLIWIEPVELAGATVRVIRMPPAKDLSEVHYAAVVRTRDEKLRYFVAEQGSARVYLAEWRSTTERMKFDTLAENASADFLDKAPSNAAPWEVSRDAIPGLPYLASFLAAIREELDGQAGTTSRPLPITRVTAPSVRPRSRSPLYAAVALVALLVIAIVVVATRT